jgi:transcriptional regulator with XRE-family HTH domain
VLQETCKKKEVIVQMEYEKVISKIKQVITDKGMKQCVVAERSGFSVAEFSNMLNGRKLLRVEYIPRIANALGIEPNDLFEKEDCPTK